MRALARDNADLGLPELRELLVAEALAMVAEDEARNRAIGAFGADLLPDDARVLTHCNAGSLATAYFGTALGVIFTAHEQGKIGGVWVEPGDLVFGDLDGVVIVPKRVEAEVVERALTKARGEKLVRKEIEAGMSSTDAFRKYGIL